MSGGFDRAIRNGLLAGGVMIGVLIGGCDEGATESVIPVLPTAECRSAADCDDGQLCRLAAVTPEDVSERSLAIIPHCAEECSSDAECMGELCQQGEGLRASRDCFGSGTTCGSACTLNSCEDGWTCRADGHCRIDPCTDPQSAGCPAAWYCDAAAAAAALDGGAGFVEGLSIDGSDAVEQDPTVAQIGCRQLRCDEEGGPNCLPGWICEPALAAPDSVGCRALPCAEGGVCSDTVHICEPTSSHRRVGGMDPHGCVLMNCEENPSFCSATEVCDFSAEANVWGCREMADCFGCGLDTGTSPPPTESTACTRDSDCGQQYCVNGSCGHRLGECQPQ